MTEEDEYAQLLGKAVIDVWGDMLPEIQEALFEGGRKGEARASIRFGEATA
jgi:hypothetical protein